MRFIYSNEEWKGHTKKIQVISWVEYKKGLCDLISNSLNSNIKNILIFSRPYSSPYSLDNAVRHWVYEALQVFDGNIFMPNFFQKFNECFALKSLPVMNFDRLYIPQVLNWVDIWGFPWPVQRWNQVLGHELFNLKKIN